MIRPARLLLLIALAACGGKSAPGGGSTPLGQTCSQSSNCASGLSCLQQSEFDPASSQCKPASSYCTVSCASDADCVSKVGAGHICIGTNADPTDCPPGMCFEGSRG